MSKKTNLESKKIFIERKSTINEKTIQSNIDEFVIGRSLKLKEPVAVRMKENWIDIITKFSALVAVLLAFITVIFDYHQSEKQDETFRSFEQKLSSTFETQLKNAEQQHQKTIQTLEQQQELMRNQNDSTIQLLKVQADRLKRQNEIWKIDQKNKIHTERAKVSASIDNSYLRNDSLRLTFTYLNQGQRVAKNIECQVAVIRVKNNILLPLIDEKAPLSMNKIDPHSSVSWSINKDFVGLLGNDEAYVYSKLSYEDEMYIKKIVTTEFVHIFNRDKKTEHSFCSQTHIDFIEKNSRFKDVEEEDFTIKKEYFPEY